MPLLLGCFALFAPRLIIVLVVLFSDYIGTAYETVIWPFLGFLFLPLTTLAYAFAIHSGDGHVSGVGLVVVVFAVLIDTGMWGGSEHARRQRLRSR